MVSQLHCWLSHSRTRCRQRLELLLHSWGGDAGQEGLEYFLIFVESLFSDMLTLLLRWGSVWEFNLPIGKDQIRLSIIGTRSILEWHHVHLFKQEIHCETAQSAFRSFYDPFIPSIRPISLRPLSSPEYNRENHIVNDHPKYGYTYRAWECHPTVAQ